MNETHAEQLFKKQERIYPKRVWGRFRRLKWIVMGILLLIYYITPWIRWDRGPHAPDQAVLIDIPHARAYFFGIEIWPQEVYYITGILILAAIGLFFITSLFGRAWCGYACPQTVWTDLYVHVERFVQGDRTQRMRLAKAPWRSNKLFKISTTHFLWLLIALVTGGAWVFYFNDAPTLLEQILHFDVPWSVLAWILALTGSTYLMAGFAREQVCTYMCPYARFQSAMFDKDSLIIGYDDVRGEPRGKHKAGETWDGRGHCVNCTACVQVCPMGIDIRDGLQMECIACGLCIDACDQIMDRLDLPRNLIRYDTENNIERRISGKGEKTNLLRPRTFYYIAILSLVSGLMLYQLLNKSAVKLHVLHDRNPLFTLLSNGQIRNGYHIKILNKTHADQTYKLTVTGLKDPQFKLQAVEGVTIDKLPVLADDTASYRLFISSEKQPDPRIKVHFTITQNDGEKTPNKNQNKTKDEFSSIFISGHH